MVRRVFAVFISVLAAAGAARAQTSGAQLPPFPNGQAIVGTVSLEALHQIAVDLGLNASYATIPTGARAVVLKLEGGGTFLATTNMCREQGCFAYDVFAIMAPGGVGLDLLNTFNGVSVTASSFATQQGVVVVRQSNIVLGGVTRQKIAASYVAFVAEAQRFSREVLSQSRPSTISWPAADEDLPFYEIGLSRETASDALEIAFDPAQFGPFADFAHASR